ncbi:T9SS type A sorting domain-containing protein [bacterium]|nr:T9SS type A sorting domain-containing protein [bacterium]
MKILSLGSHYNTYTCQEWADLGASYPIADDRNTAIWSDFGNGVVPRNVIIDTNGVVRYSGIGYNELAILAFLDDLLSPNEINEIELPDTHLLLSNHPNPFNAGTEIKYELRIKASISLSIFDERGRKVRILLQREANPGSHSIFWDALDEDGSVLPSGVYLAQLRSGETQVSKKLLLLK